MLRAAEPWSPANHELFPAPAREYARRLALLGRGVASKGWGHSFYMDMWIGVRPTPRRGAPPEEDGLLGAPALKRGRSLGKGEFLPEGDDDERD